MANEVRIKLTDEQKAKIKEATGKEMPEIRVGSLGDNPAVSANTVAARTMHPARAQAVSARVSMAATKPMIAAKATRAHRVVAAKAARAAISAKAAKATRAHRVVAAKAARAAISAKAAKATRAHRVVAAKAARAAISTKAAKSTRPTRSTRSNPVTQ